MAERATPVTYLATTRFWFEYFQNWQSEFMSVGALVLLSIFTRAERHADGHTRAGAESHAGDHTDNAPVQRADPDTGCDHGADTDRRPYLRSSAVAVSGEGRRVSGIAARARGTTSGHPAS